MTNAHNALSAPRIPVAALGWSLGTFLAISFTLCAVFALAFSWDQMFQIWLPLLPGVSFLTLPSFVLGLIETMLWGWYVALVFAPLFNFFSARFAK